MMRYLLVLTLAACGSTKVTTATSTCSDGTQNGNETGVDCGGSCSPCPAPSCSDGIQNGDQTGVDCGGSCPACAPSCSDGIQNGDETDVDCGGSCPACAPSCSDGMQNGDETDVDCGGSCPACEASCSDLLQNGDETGVDCGGSCDACPAPVPRGGRVVGIAASPSENDTGDGGSMDTWSENALEESLRAHVGVVLLRLQWGEVETSPMEYDNTVLDWANNAYARDGLRVILALDPIDGFFKSVPSDLEPTPFDDPQVIARYQQLLDHVFSRLADLDIPVLLVGNEVSPYLQETNQWQAYTPFYEAVGDYARDMVPTIEVGATGVGQSEEEEEEAPSAVSAPMQALNRHSDVIALTYYPLAPTFTWLVDTYPDKPIIITEIGFPSSPLLGSSEEIQAGFVRRVFRAWDEHASQVRYLLFFMLHDMSAEEAQGWEDMICQELPAECDQPGVHAAIFSSWGLRTYPGSGTDKLGFSALIEETEARGWEPASP
ncbi:hypothetical protein ACFL6C_07225 [Myxococcota bacterium]